MARSVGKKSGDGGQALLWRIAGILTALTVMGLGFLLVTKRSYGPPDGGTPAAATAPGEAEDDGVDPAVPPRVTAASPRRISNQASYPLTVYGEGFRPDDVVLLEGPGDAPARELPSAYLDPGHLTARVPAAIALPTQQTFGQLRIRVRRAGGIPGEGAAGLTLVNDATYPVPYALATSGDGTRVFVASPSTDAVWQVTVPAVADGEPSTPQPIPVGDRPRALGRWVGDGGGTGGAGERLVVLHELAPELWILPMDRHESKPRVVPVDGAVWPQDLAVVGQGDDAVAFVSSRGTDEIIVLRLGDGRVLSRWPTPPNPGPIAARGIEGRAPEDAAVCVSNLGADRVVCRNLAGDAADGEVTSDVGPGARIVGGHPAALSAFVMGPKAARDLWLRPGPDDTVTALASSIGPNLGPNPARAEVSMNGGVTVVGPQGAPVHVSMVSGIPQGLAGDTDRDVLYVADVGRGRLLAYDAGRLANGPPRDPRRPQLAAVALPPPKGTRMLRPPGDLGVDGRAGPELHTGPWAVSVAPGGRVFVLGRLSGQVVEVDTSGVRQGRLQVVRSFPAMPLRAQPQRRLGEVAYFTDVGDSRMSCDACHVDGREGGLLFTKGEPMHIYRTPTLLSIAESPPYFTPAMIPSLAATAQIVLSRNRFHNPDARPLEVRSLGMFQAALVEPPNPFRGPAGELPERLAPPGGSDDRAGDPRAGLALFEGKAECASCHPAPSFTTDQDEATRGRTHDVGTPNTLPLRTEMQDAAPYPLPPPSLLGVWDHFPLLDSGAGGYGVVDGERVAVTHPNAIDRVLDLAGTSGQHGSVDELTDAERRDLAAYLRTL